MPTNSGLAWLAEKGYKTLVDLRESSETNVAFIAEASRLGMRYIALPVSRDTIDRDRVTRFNFELSVGDARPLYFFDADGSRAGALWYIRRISVDHLTSQVARREAEELGLTSPEYWLTANSYLERQNTVGTPATQVPPAGPTGSVPPASPAATTGAVPPITGPSSPSPATASASVDTMAAAPVEPMSTTAVSPDRVATEPAQAAGHELWTGIDANLRPPRNPSRTSPGVPSRR